MIEKIDISKITFNQISKRYSIHFTTKDSKSSFEIKVTSEVAKKISMSIEGITSDILSPYEMFINLIDFTKLKISKVVIVRKKENIESKISLFHKDRNKSYDFYLSVTDSIIIALNTLTDIFIDSNLLNKQTTIDIKENAERKVAKNSYSLEDKLLSLKQAMEYSIKSEKFETAAKLRDKIIELKKINSNE